LVIIPHRELSAEALAGVIEEYVSRDGTELGEVAKKSEAVVRLLDRGELVLVFDPELESCNLVTREQLTTTDQNSGEDEFPE